MSLQEKDAKLHENASTQIDVPGGVASKIIETGRKLIPDDALAGDGRVEHVHITLKYGVREDEDLLAQSLVGHAPFTVTLGKVMVFEPSESSGGEAPVVVEAHASQLEPLKESIGERMGKFKDTFPYSPHVTVAYVKPDQAERFAGSDAFAGITFQATAVTLSAQDDRNKVRLPLGKQAAAPAPEIPQRPEQEVKRDEPAVEPTPEQEQPAPKKQPKPKQKKLTPQQADKLVGDAAKKTRKKQKQKPMRPTETPQFKSWFSGSKIVGQGGKPLMVFHGTTHDITEFSTEKSNPEGWYGPGFYFTDSQVDVAENYATAKGGDLTHNIENRADGIMDGLREEYEKENSRNLDYNTQDYKDLWAKAYDTAKTEFVGPNQGVTMPVYLNLKNPVYVLKSGGTYFNINYDEETGEESGNGLDLYNALNLAAGNFGGDVSEIWNKVSENGGEFSAEDFEAACRESEEIMDDEGRMVPGNLIAQVYQEMGFDGVVQDAWNTFGGGAYEGKGMKMDEGTRHYILWDPSKIKSAIGNVGTFDQKSPNITASASPALQRWFGASKVVDESFEPRVVFHGSKSPWITSFDMGMEGTGVHGHTKWGAIWFTSSQENAEEFADPKEEKQEASIDEVTVYGNDPFYAAVFDINGEPLFEVGPHPTEEEAERDGVAQAREYNKHLGENTNVQGYYLKIIRPYVTDQVPREKEFAAAKAGKHDGIIAKDVVDGYTRSDVFVVFSPSQVKSTRSVKFDPASQQVTAAVQPEAKDRLGALGQEVVEEVTIGDYDLFVTYDRNFGVYQVGMQRLGMDASDIEQQAEQQKQQHGRGSRAEVRAVVQGWVDKYHLLIIGSMNPAKTEKYVRLLKALGFKPVQRELMGIPFAMLTDGTVKLGSIRLAGRKDALTSLVMRAEVEGFPVVWVRWEGLRWRQVLKAVKAIAGEVAGRRVPWDAIQIFNSPWKSLDEQEAGWDGSKGSGQVMFDVLKNGSWVSVGGPYKPEAEAAGATEHPWDGNAAYEQHAFNMYSAKRSGSVISGQPEWVLGRVAYWEKVSAGGLGDLSLANKIMNELFPMLGEPSLPKPTMKIVNQPRAGWLGRDTWKIWIRNGEMGCGDNTEIEVQKYVLNDEDTLRRVIAHELCHHADSLVNGTKEIERYKSFGQIGYKTFLRGQSGHGHGPTWRQYTAKYNAKYGADFVNEKSDESYKQEELPIRPYYIRLWNQGNGKIYYSVSTRIGPKIKKYLERKAVEPDQAERMTKTDSRLFMHGATIGDGWSSPQGKDAEAKTKLLAELWETAQPDKKAPLSADTQDELELMEKMRNWNLTRGKGTTASHKTPPLSDTQYENPEQGMETNAYADIPERVKGTYDTPSLEELAPQMFKRGSNFQFPSFADFAAAQGMEPEDWEHEEMMYDETVAGLDFDFPLVVYRSVELPEGQEPNFEEAGVFWSSNENSAQAYFGSTSIWNPTTPDASVKTREVLMAAQVLKPEDVEWYQTLVANVKNPDENEVTVAKGAQLRLVSVDGKKVKRRMITASRNFEVQPAEELFGNEADIEEYNGLAEQFNSWRFPTDLWRAVVVSPENPLRLDGVGVYWTYDREQADPMNVSHFKEGDQTIILRAKVMSPQDVDWPATIVANMTEPQEAEVRLKPGAKLRLYRNTRLNVPGGTVTAAYAEGQNQVQHTDQRNLGISKTLKGDPFHEEYALLHGGAAPSAAPPIGDKQEGNVPHAKGEEELAQNMKQGAYPFAPPPAPEMSESLKTPPNPLFEQRYGQPFDKKNAPESPKRPVVDTPEFKAWFGDSKVVNNKGEPLMMFHSTRAVKDFDTFKTSPVKDEGGWASRGKPGDPFDAIGAWFAADKKLLHEVYEFYRMRRKGPPRTMPVYLSIKTPLYIEHRTDLEGTMHNLIQKYLPEVWAKWHRMWNEEGMKEPGRMTKAKAARKACEMAGYDGVKLANDYHGQAWVAFYPSQIKSAIGNTGKFDPSSTSITSAETDLFARVAGDVPRAALAKAQEMLDALHGNTQLCGDSEVVDGWWVETHTLGCRNAADEPEEQWQESHDRLLDEYRGDGVSHVIMDDSGIFATVTPQRPKQAASYGKFTGEQVVDHVLSQHKDWSRDTAYQVVGLDAGGDYKLRDYPLRKLVAGDDYDPSLAERYAKMGTPLPPIVLDGDGRIRDGNHRVAAGKIRGDKTIQAYVPIDTFKTAAPDYEGMFKSVLTLTPEAEAEYGQRVKAEIAWARKDLKKQDRIVWWLRWFRLAILDDMQKDLPLKPGQGWSPSSGTEQPQPDAQPSKVEQTFKNELKAMAAKSPGAWSAKPLHWFTGSTHGSFQHFMSLPVAKIQNTVWDKQTPDSLLQGLKGYEEEWQEQTKGLLQPDLKPREVGQDETQELQEKIDAVSGQIKDLESQEQTTDTYQRLIDLKNERFALEQKAKQQGQEVDTVFLQFADGWAWWKLSRAYCSEEARAMGHCGNVVGQDKTDERILSLRKPVKVDKEDMWEPHLTFILEPSGLLGEMKGKANNKPVAAYHKYIVPLLEMPAIKGIRGGGYAPEKNFSLADLPREEQDRLVAAKPGLLNCEMFLKKYGVTDELVKRVSASLEWDLKWLPGVQGFDMGTYPSLDNFIEERGDETAQYVGKVMSGDEFMEIEGTDHSDAIDNLDRAHEKVVADYLRANYPEAIAEWENQTDETWDGGDSDMKRLLDDDYNEELDEPKELLRQAVDTGRRWGAEQAMFKAVMDGIDNMSEQDDNKLGISVAYQSQKNPQTGKVSPIWDAPLTEYIPIAGAAKLADSGGTWENYQDNEVYGYDNGTPPLEVSQPHYGWDGFDKDGFNQEIMENFGPKKEQPAQQPAAEATNA